ncbi:MAG: hypothetical protein C4523_20450 [Myxococcales bacterium]|nr:MAG: hypothetical protein C4523_20450 [Myxococcales bacterium]
MIFEEIFRPLIERADEALACLLMGFDGLKVAAAAKPGVAFDLELMGAEAAAIVGQLGRASFAEQFGRTEEVVFRSAKTSILLRAVSPEYFVVLVLRPDAPVGKGRFLLSLIEPALARELG